MPKYAIGVDFGTLSGRAVLVELGTSRELASSVWNYEYGVMDERLPDGTPLPADWALQMPADYLAVLSHAVPAVLREGRVAPRDVIGIGIDFTACTVIAVDRQGRPMCELPQWRGNPHSYVKLWKHHAAQDQANRLNAAAGRAGGALLGPVRRKDQLGMDVPQNLAGAGGGAGAVRRHGPVHGGGGLGGNANDRPGMPERLHRRI